MATFHRAQIWRGDHELLEDGVEVQLHEHNPPQGLKSWTGSFESSSDFPDLEPGEQLHLILLDDGRSGAIIIQHMTLPAGNIQFVGTGPLV